MSGWVIETENLSKTFAWTPVLEGISCRIGTGEVVGIFGPNGVGKTTFLRLLATLLTPSRGTLKLFARAPHDPSVRQQLGFLGHDSFLYPDLTPVENLTFYGRAYGLTNVRERITAVLTQVGMPDWGNTAVRTFSRGMEQRLALARTILHDPDLLLLDEPYTGLDTQGITMLQTILAHNKAQGKTIVLATHDLALGLALCDRAFIFHHGRIAWQSAGPLPSLEEFTNLYHSTTSDF